MQAIHFTSLLFFAMYSPITSIHIHPEEGKAWGPRQEHLFRERFKHNLLTDNQHYNVYIYMAALSLSSLLAGAPSLTPTTASNSLGLGEDSSLCGTPHHATSTGDRTLQCRALHWYYNLATPLFVVCVYTAEINTNKRDTFSCIQLNH